MVTRPRPTDLEHWWSVFVSGRHWGCGLAWTMGKDMAHHLSPGYGYGYRAGERQIGRFFSFFSRSIPLDNRTKALATSHGSAGMRRDGRVPSPISLYLRIICNKKPSPTPTPSTRCTDSLVLCCAAVIKSSLNGQATDPLDRAQPSSQRCDTKVPYNIPPMMVLIPHSGWLAGCPPSRLFILLMLSKYPMPVRSLEQHKPRPPGEPCPSW
ncbi:hypothetical protein B0I35DRAFT_109939 [Stachybotrys elegans]|uniref:Uncharacterized protein n=1 Tax=Stachybotrys elegans TaxID=80388 RepID=A0A8K0WKI9_9HYPO|nr:hypothetical protein B0I35DRAFT_109939 [Stachybotrys elegans]